MLLAEAHGEGDDDMASDEQCLPSLPWLHQHAPEGGSAVNESCGLLSRGETPRHQERCIACVSMRERWEVMSQGMGLSHQLLAFCLLVVCCWTRAKYHQDGAMMAAVGSDQQTDAHTMTLCTLLQHQG